MLLAIAGGGALGGLARYGLGSAFPVAAGAFPWTTWAVNVSGSFALAVVVTLAAERWPGRRLLRPFLAVGFCGGYTTWSTAMTETVLLARDHHAPTAAAYLVASLLAGPAAMVAGLRLTTARLAPETPPEAPAVAPAEATAQGAERGGGGP